MRIFKTGAWLTSADHLRKQAVPTRTVIGVVGNTGAGKSSVINAMLDEERLVPTNCMRACTAVVTELSYNHGQKPYRAEIEFITAQDWRKELETLFRMCTCGYVVCEPRSGTANSKFNPQVTCWT